MEVKDGLKTGGYYQFDSYTVDLISRTLKHGNEVVELTPKVFATLLALIENRDKVLTKDELLTIIWPDQFVDQSNLSQNISVLRKSLGEAESGTKYIATFPGRGYRFVCQIELKHHRTDERATAPDSVLPAESEVETQTIAPSAVPRSRSARSKSTLRKSSLAIIIACCCVTLAAIVAFAIRDDLRHRNLKSTDGNNVPLKIFARMNAALTQPSWSRDGKALAFVGMDLNSVRSTIYVQLTGDIQPHGIVSGLGQYSSPTWSPDSTQLAFVHIEPVSAEIVIFDIQKGTFRVLANLFPRRYGLNYRHLDWSSDGKFLVVDDKTVDSEPFSIYLIYIEDGQRVRLTYPDSDMIGDLAPRISRDGTKVAFIRDIDYFEQDVYVTSIRGRTNQRITSDHALISDVGWKTNNTVMFAADRGDGFKLWKAELDKRTKQEEVAPLITSEVALQFSIAPDGYSVAFSSYSPNLDIWSIDVSKPFNGPVPVIEAHGENIRPSVSPDGKHLAFLSNVSGEFQIWASEVDGTNASVVPTENLVPASFCWSADSKSLIFSPQRIHGIYEVPVQGSAPARQISSIYTDPYSAIDGKSFFVRAHFFIYRIPLSGGSAQEVTEQGGAPIAQSRDRRYLYFSQGRMSTTIGRLDLQTGHQDEIIGSLVPGYSDAWALSSGGIVFLGEEQSKAAVKFLSFTTGKKEVIADFPGELPQVEMAGFGISPDGKRLLVVRADPIPSDIKIMMLGSD
jgi:DNA-binding winged helix-turn-helix (wHTH) protein/Tol biopolymer transport system component